MKIDGADGAAGAAIVMEDCYIKWRGIIIKITKEILII
jgi:hypothetical protein